MTKFGSAVLAAFLSASPAALADDGFWTGATPAPKASEPKASEPKATEKAAPAKAAESKAASPAAAPGLAGIEALEATLAEAWERAPLTQRHAVFVAEKPELYGGFTERSNRRFARGEKLVTYVEPVGYTWIPQGDGRYVFGFILDFKVKLPNGKILAGQDGFQSFDFTSRFKNREVFMNVTMSLDGIEPGEYVLVYTLHDKGGDKASSFEQPFTIPE